MISIRSHFRMNFLETYRLQDVVHCIVTNDLDVLSKMKGDLSILSNIKGLREYAMRQLDDFQ